ncbi:MAG: hypothetical protein KGH61_02970 [Candidatus Micrarchaeota archaeon]|nr:hypothetical protein [Candidatus Micrarchaeota archaeon]MDE1847885.1 hypothetical protein [Candidatus Micrarchaeota archaeon]MDE1864511.1 hypothetical protein [Candidatus Micrarchaeota archaeon]
MAKQISHSGFMFLKPMVSSNSNAIATAIAQAKGVSGVFLTSGDYGFVISLDLRKGKKINQIKRSVMKISGSAVHVAMNHVLYRNDGKAARVRRRFCTGTPMAP